MLISGDRRTGVARPKEVCDGLFYFYKYLFLVINFSTMTTRNPFALECKHELVFILNASIPYRNPVQYFTNDYSNITIEPQFAQFHLLPAQDSAIECSTQLAGGSEKTLVL